MAKQLQTNTAFQWGAVCGLLVFSFVLLTGIAFRIAPFVIFQRAMCSAVATCLAAQLVARAMDVTTKRKR